MLHAEQGVALHGPQRRKAGHGAKIRVRHQACGTEESCRVEQCCVAGLLAVAVACVVARLDVQSDVERVDGSVT
jgi:hypothetical protein